MWINLLYLLYICLIVALGAVFVIAFGCFISDEFRQDFFNDLKRK